MLSGLAGGAGRNHKSTAGHWRTARPNALFFQRFISFYTLLPEGETLTNVLCGILAIILLVFVAKA